MISIFHSEVRINCKQTLAQGPLRSNLESILVCSRLLVDDQNETNRRRQSPIFVALIKFRQNETTACSAEIADIEFQWNEHTMLP